MRHGAALAAPPPPPREGKRRPVPGALGALPLPPRGAGPASPKMPCTMLRGLFSQSPTHGMAGSRLAAGLPAPCRRRVPLASPARGPPLLPPPPPRPPPPLPAGMAAGPASLPSRLRAAAAAAILGEGGRGRGRDVAGARLWRRRSPGEAPAPTCSSPPPPPSSASTCPSSPSAKRPPLRPTPRCCPPVRRQGDTEGGQPGTKGMCGVPPGLVTAGKGRWGRGSPQSRAGAPRGAAGPVRVGWTRRWGSPSRVSVVVPQERRCSGLHFPLSGTKFFLLPPTYCFCAWFLAPCLRTGADHRAFSSPTRQCFHSVCA